uniref:Uncharacterized protein n=1 Tax=Anguilla anguilla TaxID=7936 RepID=A0A0E9XFD5_ANGAN
MHRFLPHPQITISFLIAYYVYTAIATHAADTVLSFPTLACKNKTFYFVPVRNQNERTPF